VVAGNPDARDTVTPQKKWIYFADHGEESPAGLAARLAENRQAPPLSARSLERRRNRGARSLTDVHDLPVHRAYVQQLRETGCTVKRLSRYLNAASVIATPDQLRAIEALPFVARVAPVRRYTRRPTDVRFEQHGSLAPEAGIAGRAPTALDYGSSYDQVNQINVPPLHDDGFSGDGVMIGLFDTGFNLGHAALEHINLEAEWDFVFDDANTRNQAVDVASQHNHGTQVLSVMAGYAPGSLVGPAYGATFVLAKTERVWEEVQGEEDDFVAALEWADSIGVDLITSSLGYFAWYTFDDLDGNTAVTTIACDIAASKGITMVVVAGNERNSTWGHLIAPGDADSVITVGAVDASGALASFSSPGPTSDGRIKPDVMARGVSTRMVTPWDSLGYTIGSGTSFSTPLVAGACALLLEMRPAWGPIDIRTALRNEASNSGSPDNDFGWGIIDAYQSALNGATGIVEAMSLNLALNGFDVSGTIYNGLADGRTVDVVRRKERSSGGGWEAPLTVAGGIVVPGSSSVTFSDRLDAGGVYEYRVELTDDPSQVTSWSTIKLVFPLYLSQNAPNPFVAGAGLDTEIRYTIGGIPPDPGAQAPIGTYSDVLLEVYDVRGARVATLFEGILAPQQYTSRWNGLDNSGNPAATGVYFYRLTAGSQSMTRKMVLIRR
jgi:hypothetical protein